MPIVDDVAVPLDRLTPYKGNSRIHSPEQIATLADMIKRFGFTQPILVDENDIIIAGYGRYQAAQSLNLSPVPCRRVSGLSESERRALVIADNKIQEKSTWDYDLLLSETQLIASADLDLGESLNSLLDLTSLPSTDASFQPVLDPVQGAGLGVTDQSVAREQQRLDNQFSDRSDQNLASITCPYCDESFTVDASTLQ